MAIFPLQGLVYMVIASCIIYANSGYFKFDKVGIQAIVKKNVGPLDEVWKIGVAKFGDVQAPSQKLKLKNQGTLVLKDSPPNGSA